MKMTVVICISIGIGIDAGCFVVFCSVSLLVSTLVPIITTYNKLIIHKIYNKNNKNKQQIFYYLDINSMSINSEENDILRLVSSQCHIGTQNLNELMKPYVSHRSKSGVQIIDVKKTLEKIKLAARAIVTVENSEDVIVVSARPYG